MEFKAGWLIQQKCQEGWRTIAITEDEINADLISYALNDEYISEFRFIFRE